MTRLENWELRLNDVVEDARGRPYVLGAHDCFRFACAAVEALCGVDLWKPWAGRYATRGQARRLILEYDPRGFTAAFSKLFGSDPVPSTLARRGDILEYVDEESHLGVCLGASVAVLGESGLAFVPVARCAHAWRIG